MHFFQIIINNFLSIFNFLIISETTLAIMIAFTLFVFKKNKKANFFLAFFIIIHSVSFLPVYFLRNNLVTLNYYSVLFTMPANSLAGVFIYYHTIFMAERIEKFNKKDIIPLIFFLFILIAYFKFKTPNPGNIPLPNPMIIQLLIASGLIISIIYSILALNKIKKYSKDIKDYFSEIKNMDMNWLRKIIYFSILSSFSFAMCLGLYSVLNIRSLYVVSFDLILFIIILFILIFYIINQPALSRENRRVYSILKKLNTENNNLPAKKYEKVNLVLEKQEAYLKLLDTYMDSDKPYLNERITIKDLSERLNLPCHHLSIVINNLLKKNFYDFINDYRIRDVVNFLNESKNETVDILSIAFKCGFNSKTTFNRVFKKKMGITPSMYKNRCES